MTRYQNTKLTVVSCLLLVVATLATYSRVRSNPFTSFDDDTYVVRNLHVQAGVTWKTVTWALTSTAQSNWHPLTWMSHALDCQLYGLNPAGHHLTSVFIHALNVVLLFLLLLRATGHWGRSLLVAALFALHPLNVESVAWIAERKNVLSTLFFLSALGAYGWYSAKPGVKRYLVVAAFFALGLAAKPMVITLPFVFLLMDFWPLQRVQGWGPATASRARAGKRKQATEDEAIASPLGLPSRPVSRLLIEKLPLFIFLFASAIITVIAQRSSAIRSLSKIPMDERLENALYSYALYIWKAFWPTRLALFYPHPTDTLTGWQLGLAFLFLFSVTALVWNQRSVRPYLVTGWLWYLGTLVPVIGIVQVGDQAMADRYAYIPLIGIFVMVVWGIGDWADGRNVNVGLRWAASAAVLAAFSFLTWRQIGYWRSDYELWTHPLELTKVNYLAETNLASSLRKLGRAQDALPHYQAAERLNPGQPARHINLAADLAESGDLQDAISEYQIAAELTDQPRTLARVDESIAALSAALGDYGTVRESYKQAWIADPQHRQDMIQALIEDTGARPTPGGFFSLGFLLEQDGRPSDAREAYAQALKLDPALAEAKQALDAIDRENK
ncbi:MAG: tetratricopeptide repeat protein [Terriglobales bacterium]